MKRLIAIICAIILCATCIPHVFALASADVNYKAVKIEGKYHASEILNALEKQTRSADSLTTAEKAILNDVLLPASMGITIPNINISKIVQTADVYTLDEVFSESLEEHGVFRSHMTFSEYEEIESTWLLPEDFIEATKFSYPELQDVDMSTWTYGMYSEYIKQKDEERFLARFTSEELRALKKRGIRIDDLSILLSSYHTIDNVLAQSDEDLKATIESAYSFSIENLRATVNPTPGYMPAGTYTQAVFPGFMNGQAVYFNNAVMTTAYWRGIQSARALRMQQVLYNHNSNTLCCTNLYGTYFEVVQNNVRTSGSHEGIDFTDPGGRSTPPIYAIFSGTVLSNNMSHRICVYDANHPNGQRTHSYMHMSYIESLSQVSVGQHVGAQGNEGWSDGYHVHFEVNDGWDNTTALEDNHTIGSSSPYWVVNYIGCAGTHTYTWVHDSTNHWRECTVTACRFTSTPASHIFYNGFCKYCGRRQYIGIVSK